MTTSPVAGSVRQFAGMSVPTVLTLRRSFSLALAALAVTSCGNRASGGVSSGGSLTGSGASAGAAASDAGASASSGSTSAGSGASSGSSGSSGSGSTRTTGSSGGNESSGVSSSSGATVPVSPPGVSYEVTGTWPAHIAGTTASPIKQTHGTLTYKMVQVQDQFLAESCSIADYNRDGIPDISSGRRWYEGPDFTKVHIFRGGHDALPRQGTLLGGALSPTNELFNGESDDWADYPYDVDGDGWPDIINISNPQYNTIVSPAPKPQGNSTGYWYKNPGAPANEADTLWTSSLISSDLNMEEHAVADVDGDGKPEILGACESCAGGTKGYYEGDWSNPTAPWTFHSVTRRYEFPFGGTGHLNGVGMGDVNGDGRPDLLERSGVWLRPASLDTGTAGWDPATSWVPTAFSVPEQVGDSTSNQGGAQMFAYDVDGDGLTDVISADRAYGWGLAWYQQLPPGVGSCLGTTTTLTTAAKSCFVKHPIMLTNSIEDLALYKVAFSELHAVELVDMDGDGLPDIVTGKNWLDCPYSCGDVDPDGTPVVYVFKLVRDANPPQAGMAHFEPHLVNAAVPASTAGDAGAFPATWTGGSGVGRQVAIGQINPQTDGIMDICIASKLGLYVYLGQ